MKVKFCLLMLLGAVLLLWRPVISTANPASTDVHDESERARWAGEVLDEILSAPDNTIARDLLDESKAVAVIPHVVKGAFIVGGCYGKGLISRRGDDGKWSAPAFITLGGGSIGFQIGASSTDYIMVFTNEKGLTALLKGKVELGADASVAAGPVGRTADAATDITLNSEIYSYSRSKGVFAGIALKGAVLKIDDSADHKVYNNDYSADEILLQNRVKSNDVTNPFINALNMHIK
jgi:lipid-binding SYLF domain-containing protein